MESLLYKELILEGLNCANCAAKIEKESSKIKEVAQVNLDFISRKMTIQFENIDDEVKILNQVESIVKKIEPDVRVRETLEEKVKSKFSEEAKLKLLRLGLGGSIFVIGIIFEFSFPIELSVFLISYLIVGYDVLFVAMKNIFRGQFFDENFLMSIATLGAFAIAQYPEAVAVMLFYQTGELLQDLAVNSSRRSIEKLMDIRPDYANLIIESEITKVSPYDVKPGDMILVKPGEKIPLDGIIIQGNSTLDTSALTGESIYRDVEPLEEVFGGFINKNGVLKIKVTKAFQESTVAKILELVQNASSKKAPTENFITKFARVYTPIVVFSALALAIIPPLIVPGASFSEWIYRAFVFLVVSCPCALVISVPLGYFGGIGAASKAGILIKGSNYLEALNKIDTVVFDKTGTLTKGSFKVVNINSRDPYSKEQVLEYAAMAESFSNHPLAKSICLEYGKDIKKEEIKNYNELSGLGIETSIYGKTVLVGNHKLMENKLINYEKEESVVGTIVYVSVEGAFAGSIIIADEIKDDSKKAIKVLKNQGIKNMVMLTGDNEATANFIGKELGIDNIYSQLLPHEKVKVLEDLKGNTIFVGDGINDAPVLKIADVGIAMGSIGSDAAIEASDVVIMRDELTKIPEAIAIAKKTNKIVWQNIIFSLSVKFTILILGAMGIATMWIAVFGDVGVALIAVLNSLRALNQ